MRIDVRAWARLPLATLALSALVIALIAGIVVVVSRGTQASELLATPAKDATPFVFRDEADSRAADLAAIRAQPLVHASRAFYQPPVEAAPQAPPRPDYRLAGAMMLPGKAAVALVIHRTSSESKRVKPGDDLDGWRVASVDRKVVTLTWGNDRAEITAGSGTPVATSVAATGGGGLTRVPIVRDRVSAVGAGVQSLSAKGTAPSSRGGLSEQPRLYRPPPQ